MSINPAITPASSALCERVLRTKKTHRLTFQQIAEVSGMSRSTIINQLNGYFNIDIRVVLAVAELCPDVSADYLLRGRGEMYAATHAATAISATAMNTTATAATPMSANGHPNADLESRIARLEQIIDNQYNKNNPM